MKNQIIRFIDCHVPTETCNFRCPYCYITQRRLFDKKLNKISRTPQEVRVALSQKRWGGILFINFCAGGETLLGDDLLPIIKELLKEGHFVQIVTNGSMTDRFKEIVTWDKVLLEHLFIKFSYHFIELKRLNLVDVFFDNVVRVRNAGVSISLEITPGDDMIPYIEEMKKISLEKVGALPHVTVARNENTAGFEVLTSLSDEDYRKVWGQFKSPMFDLKLSLLSEKRTEFCYAGEWTFFLQLGSGDLKQCYRGKVIDNIYKDVTEPIHFKPIEHKCPESYCYNGHVWMTLGVIPEKEVITYADIRDRECSDGSHWLSVPVKEAFSSKLRDQHCIYRDVKEFPRIVLFGDSIFEGYRGTIRENLDGKAYVLYTNGNARFSTYLLRYVAEWANDMRVGSDADIVHFNVGLWDIARINGDDCLVSLDDYGKNLRRIIKQFHYVFPNAKTVFSTTTPVNEKETRYSLLRLNVDVEKYNELAVSIMQELNVEVIDLNTFAKTDTCDDYIDMVHYNENGYKKMGDYLSGQLLNMIGDDNE